MEVLLASAVALLVVSASLAVLVSGFRVLASIRGNPEQSLTEQHVLFETLEADLAAAAPICATPVPFCGDAGSLSLMRLWSGARTVHSIRPVRVAWAPAANGGLERALFLPGEEKPFRSDLFSLPAPLRFEYASRLKGEKPDEAASPAPESAASGNRNRAGAGGARGAGARDAAAEAAEEEPVLPVVWQDAWTKKSLPVAVRVTCSATVLEVPLLLSRPEDAEAGGGKP